MEIFGYNLKENMLTLFRSNLINSLYFGYSSRHNTDWGNGVLLHVNSISTLTTGTLTDLTDLEVDEYFMTFFDEDVNDYHLFKVIKAGTLNTGAYNSWNSSWLIIEKISKTAEYFTDKYSGIEPDIPVISDMESISFETLLSQQTVANISNQFSLYKLNYDGLEYTLTDLTSSLVNDELQSIKNIDNSLYNKPMDSKLVSIGIQQYNSNDFNNLKFLTNIYDGSYSKCYNLSLTVINKIQTQEINLANITFDLINQDDIVIVSGLKFKNMIQISKIDYALVFEYATQTGSKSLTVTTENFIDNDGTEQLGIFMDSNLELINTNEGKVSAIDSNLLNNNLLKNSLNFDRTTMYSSESNASTFFKYMLNDAFIEHNKISTDNIYFITKQNMTVAGWSSIDIEGETYYIGDIISDVSVANAYNIKNLLVEIDLSTDFEGSKNAIYDLYRASDGYRIYKSPSATYLLSSSDFRLREIMLYYKDTLNVFHPIYYSRLNQSLNNDGIYKFRIIL